MDGDIRPRVAAANPLGKLRPGNLLGLQERAVAVVDVRQNAVVDERAELLVIGIEQLVINDLGQHLLAAGDRLQFVELPERQHGRLFDQHGASRPRAPARAASKWRSSGVATQTKSTPAASSDSTACAPEKFFTPAVAAPPARKIRLRPFAGARRDGRQRNFDRPERPVVEAGRPHLLEERTVRFVENHPHADHAAAQDVDRASASGRRSGRGGIDGRVHGWGSTVLWNDSHCIERRVTTRRAGLAPDRMSWQSGAG